MAGDRQKYVGRELNLHKLSIRELLKVGVIRAYDHPFGEFIYLRNVDLVAMSNTYSDNTPPPPGVYEASFFKKSQTLNKDSDK